MRFPLNIKEIISKSLKMFQNKEKVEMLLVIIIPLQYPNPTGLCFLTCKHSYHTHFSFQFPIRE